MLLVITTFCPVSTNRVETNYVCINEAKCSNYYKKGCNCIDFYSQNVVIITKRGRI